MAVCVGFGLDVWTAGGASGNFVAGWVVTFLGVICLCLFCTAATIIRQLIGHYTSLIALVWSIVRQVQNTYGQRDRIVWPWLVIVMGSLSMIWGIVVLALGSESYYLTPGFVMTGLGLVASAFSARWVCSPWCGGGRSALPNGCPCSRFSRGSRVCSWQRSCSRQRWADSNVFIPARVLVGRGAICFSLYSIVSILESGTSSSG
jgi:hypothetical protein